MGTELRHLKCRLSHLFRSICLFRKLLCNRHRGQVASSVKGKQQCILESAGKRWWAHQDLNLEPTNYEFAALTD
jgi:hypothetical protein